MLTNARNQLSGKVATNTRGAVNDQALGLAIGSPASAVFKVSSVIIGVKALWR